ncbi:MAG: magnesium transporter [Clostridia bacterium]|nr:magnesium transporter [Clostridia bacterium]
MEEKEILIDEAFEPLTSEQLIPKIDELVELIESRRYTDFVRIIADVPAADIAELFDEIEDIYRPRFFRLLPKELAAEVFVRMDSDSQENIITAFTDRELASILEELYVDDTVDIIEEMPANVVKRMIRNCSHENRSEINRLLRYPKDSAGTIMTTEYVRFKGTMTVREALDHIRRVAIDKETIYTCYVTDAERHLEGIVTAKDLLISPLDTTLVDIMEESVISVKTTDDREDVANKFHKYDFLALPVVDAEHRLVGIVTVDDAIDVIKEEVEEDFAKMAGITPTETPYLKTSVFTVFRSRIPWLLLLMVSATVSSTILSFFENNLASILVLFVPMLMDTGGNSGNQASVTLVRGLSLGEVKRSDFLRVWWREFRVGVLCGAILGTVAFGKIMLVDHLIMQNDSVTLTVAAVVGVTLSLTIIIAKFIGSTLPLIASKVGLDPAVVASPFITTSVDAISLILYYFIATPFFAV